MDSSESRIINEAKRLGADLVGIADIHSLQQSPSHRLLANLGNKIDGEYSNADAKDFRKIHWPVDAKSVLVIGLSHPQDKPEMDWFYPTGNTAGNRSLIKISKSLSAWIEKEERIKTYPMHYYVEKGGIYLKDAAVLAGFGCIGLNNLLITPEFGSKTRLRGILLDAQLKPTGPIKFDPCTDCQQYCRKVCPQKAFGAKVVLPHEVFFNELPGRDGFFKRSRCLAQMNAEWQVFEDLNIQKSLGSKDNLNTKFATSKTVKHCRLCELVCPVGGN